MSTRKRDLIAVGDETSFQLVPNLKSKKNLKYPQCDYTHHDEPDEWGLGYIRPEGSLTTALRSAMVKRGMRT